MWGSERTDTLTGPKSDPRSSHLVGIFPDLLAESFRGVASETARVASNATVRGTDDDAKIRFTSLQGVPGSYRGLRITSDAQGTPHVPIQNFVLTVIDGPDAGLTYSPAYLAKILEEHAGNVSAAARAAGIDRIHFYRLLWRNGLK